MSTKSILAPHKSAQLLLATKEFGTVHTISLVFKPSAKQEICKALVALFVATAYLPLV